MQPATHQSDRTESPRTIDTGPCHWKLDWEGQEWPRGCGQSANRASATAQGMGPPMEICQSHCGSLPPASRPLRKTFQRHSIVRICYRGSFNGMKALWLPLLLGFPDGSAGKQSACNEGDARYSGLIPGWGKISWRREGQPIPVFLPGESHGQRSLVGYSPWGARESE